MAHIPHAPHLEDWHTLETATVLNTLDTTQAGLHPEEAKARLDTFGLNYLPKTKKRSPILRFLIQFHNILIYVLIGSAMITMLLGHWVDTGVILAVVVANAIIGFIQEGKAEKAMDALRHMLAPRANIIRQGKRIRVEGEQLVPGDMVLLEAGDKVPADIRLMTTHRLCIQEALLTGESIPVEKHPSPVAKEAVLGDRACMAYSGTMVTTGQGKGIVVRTGRDTEIGRISGLLQDIKPLTTPLVSQMSTFAKWLTVLILWIAGLLLAFGYYVTQTNFAQMFMAVVGLSVAAIPEGLPAILTITLAIGVQAMAQRNAIVRRLPAIETLGAISVICTDKTGTLTRNEMMVASVVDSTQCFTIEGEGYTPLGRVTLGRQPVCVSHYPSLTHIARATTLCNDAALCHHDDQWHVEGDPMEGALLTFAHKVELDVQEEQLSWTRTDTLPFDSQHRFMATLHHDHEGHAYLYVKGAHEQILAMCHAQFDTQRPNQPIDLPYWHTQAQAIASKGQRVLAVAVKPMAPKHTVLERKDLEGSLILLGLVGLIDPPRIEAIQSIKACHRAGIRVKMITGDHAMTASAIGKEIGLHNPNQVLTGAEIDNMEDIALHQAILNCDIYARTTPEHKLRLVMALQAHKMTVAMTGDGVNDAPALKRADAGIAMGQKGSEAAKEAAELVLADDNFASIVSAIRAGRTVYDNIKKVISWTLPTNAGEAMTIIVALLAGLTLPITPIQILWVNLITAITLGVALAFEPTEENTMLRPPRARYEPLLNSWLIWHIILVSLLFVCGVFGIYQYAIDQGYSLELSRTMALNTLVVMEIFHLFFIRNIYGTSLTLKAIQGTKTIWCVVFIITVAQFFITYFPPLQAIFQTQGIHFWDGVLIIGIGMALFMIIEIEKQLRLVIKGKGR